MALMKALRVSGRALTLSRRHGALSSLRNDCRAWPGGLTSMALEEAACGRIVYFSFSNIVANPSARARFIPPASPAGVVFATIVRPDRPVPSPSPRCDIEFRPPRPRLRPRPPRWLASP